MSVSALFGGLAQLARSLTVLVSTCERAATVDEGCAASIETLLVPVTLWINGGIAISAACDKGWGVSFGGMGALMDGMDKKSDGFELIWWMNYS